MNERRVRILQTLIGSFVGIAVGLSIVLGNYAVPIIAVILGLIAVRSIRSRAEREEVVLEDERAELIASKASDRTLRTVTILLATLGFALKFLGYSNADILLYTACVTLIVYLIFHRYYAYKMGGL